MTAQSSSSVPAAVPPPSACRDARGSARARRERGSEGIQFAAIALPLLMLLFGALQGGLYFVTSMQASSAAHAGVQAARSEGGTLGAGISAAQTSLAQIGIARDVSVSGSRGATDASITVSAHSPTLIPLLSLPIVVATAQGPVERVTS